ncbi:beta-hydroxyacyl-ACP dehydratase [Micromonospora sp. DR5-3]|uniref:3-hydroxyacyl-ACP dehydratase FabZ family protein n=1 Tax=unclassified Micromonospora TaxID=2617518 RepID=UPI001CA3304F|nr:MULTISPECIES: beta-hydroxyacyl-ACP dehydratase [unclassified Micromonospora]MCW3817592.1 beta-hydroxyacyl-ACP dehydratase [Micromonospora sp. DR5-3]
MNIGQRRIKQTIPHRFPILLVDRVVEVVPGERLRALKAVTGAEPAYADVAQDAPESAYAYPVPLLIESWAQAAVLLAVWETPNPDVLAGKVELAGAINDIRVHAPVFPGSMVEHQVEIVKAIGDTSILAGRTLCGGEPILEVNHFVLALRDISLLAGPESRTEEAQRAGV